MQITQALHRAVQLHPHRIAVRFEGRRPTFLEFEERVARLAGALQMLGMRRGDRVAMLSLNSDRYLEYQMAVPWGGGVLNPCNTRWSPADIVYSLSDSGSTILLVDEHFMHLADGLQRDARTVRELIHCGHGPPPAGMRSYEARMRGAGTRICSGFSTPAARPAFRRA